MISFCIGLPGRFIEWCDRAIALLMTGGEGDVLVHRWPPYTEMLDFAPGHTALREVGLALVGNCAGQLLMSFREPDASLRAALNDSGTAFIVALDDPRNAVLDLIADTGAEFGRATRAVANSCPTIMQFTSLPGARVLNSAAALADIRGTLAAIAAHLGLPVNETAIAAIHKELASAEHTQALVGRDASRKPLADAERRILDGALGAYAEHFAHGTAFSQIVWRRELFIAYAEGFQRPTGMLDIAPTPRPLIYGPYMHLPPGRWSARLILGFSPETAGSSFLVDVYANGELGRAVIVPNTGGVYTVEIIFFAPEPLGEGIEIRVTATSVNGHGSVALGYATLQPIVISQPEAANAFEKDFQSVLAL